MADKTGQLSSVVPGLLVHTGLYNIHIALFTLSVYIHLKRRTSTRWIHLSTISTLFALSTVAYFVTVSDLLRRAMNPQETSMNILDSYYTYLAFTPLIRVWGYGVNVTAVHICYTLSNVIADIYITYRCFIVWGRSKRIVILPLILILAMLGCQIGLVPGYTSNTVVFVLTPVGGVVFTFVTNLLVTLLTAGRIWWIGRQGRNLLRQKILSRYARTVQIVMESGLLYPASLLITIVMISTSASSISLNCIFASNICIVNIAPTLIVIRIGLGVTTENVTTLKPVDERADSLECTSDYDSLPSHVLDMRRGVL